MRPGEPQLTRSDLAARTQEVVKPGHGIKPDVLLVEVAGGRVIVKDYARRGPLVRHFLGPWLARREQRVIRSLETVAAVPRSLGAIDPLAFVLEFRPGEPLSRALARRVGADRIERFLADLEDSLAAMYDCGVIHLDLRHRDNILLGEDSKPVLLDFAAAMAFRPGSFWYRWYRPTVRIYDERALAKWRDRLRPGALTSRRSFRRRVWSRLRGRSGSRDSRSANRAG